MARTRPKTGGRAPKNHGFTRARVPKAQSEAQLGALLVAGGDPRPPEVVEAITTQVMKLLTECMPRQDIYAAMSHLPPRTVDDYIRRARGRMIEAHLGEQKELLADSLARVEYQIAHGGLESRDIITGERLLAELRGLLSGRGGVAVQVNVGTNMPGAPGQPADDWSKLDADQGVILDWLLGVARGELVAVPRDALQRVLAGVGPAF